MKTKKNFKVLCNCGVEFILDTNLTEDEKMEMESVEKPIFYFYRKCPKCGTKWRLSAIKDIKGYNKLRLETMFSTIAREGGS